MSALVWKDVTITNAAEKGGTHMHKHDDKREQNIFKEISKFKNITKPRNAAIHGIVTLHARYFQYKYINIKTTKISGTKGTTQKYATHTHTHTSQVYDIAKPSKKS